MTYNSPTALEMAVKAAASASSMDTGRAVSNFYFHRLLCRVFADGNESFVLKGGHAMLARTVDARATRDIDLLARQRDLEGALDKLVSLAGKDLGDFIFFEFDGASTIKAEDEYRSGLSVRFTPILGTKRMQQISIDLVVDEVPLDDVDRITPADRMDITGLATCDYSVYSAESALADKLCALLETHDGRPSSRVKDLVDIVVYATTCELNGKRLQERVKREAAMRGISLPRSFKTPDGWGAPQERQYTKLCEETGLPNSLKTIDAATELAGSLFNPALSSSVGGQRWNPESAEWQQS